MSDDDVRLPADPLGRLLHRISSAFAIAGGFVLVGMILLVVISVLGRAIFLLPVPGDFEMVGIACGISVFLFLPYCYLQRGNVVVDLFVRHLPPAVTRALDAFAACVFALVSALFAWRMTFGLVDTLHYQDISMIVGVPLWWAYPFAVASFGLMAVAALYTAFRPGSDAHA
jgi:TRAP-type C4-dicarboxylate transport system permease small subunit